MFSCHEWGIMGNENHWNCETWEETVLAIGFEWLTVVQQFYRK